MRFPQNNNPLGQFDEQPVDYHDQRDQSTNEDPEENELPLMEDLGISQSPILKSFKNFLRFLHDYRKIPIQVNNLSRGFSNTLVNSLMRV